MTRIALVFPYFRTRSATEMLFPPLGAASLAAQLKANGQNVKIFDGTFETFDSLMEKLISYQPDLVGVYSMVTLSRNTFRIAERVRSALPVSLLAAGGPLPTLYPDRYAETFDAVFRGEADLSFPHFCRDYFSQVVSRFQLRRMRLENYEGLFIRSNELQVDNPSLHYPEKELDAYPLPYRGDFDHPAYQEVWRQLDGSKTTSILTTLGCPFSCDFCSRPIFGNLFRRRNLDTVFAEIDGIRALGYDSLWIADDNFTLDLAYLKEFCRRIADRAYSSDLPLGSKLEPPLPPPMGRPVRLFLKICSKPRNFRVSRVTLGWKRMPPL